MSVPTRTLGRGGPQVNAIGFGAMSIGGIYGRQQSDEERFKLLDRAYEIGERFWDTADIYMDSEDIIGKWFKRTGKRDGIFLASKFALDYSTGQETVNSDPEYAKTACAKSLQRLGVETIDLYYCHRVDQKTPVEKTVEAMVELKNQGKIRYLGLSEVSAETLRRAHAVHPISAVQVEYSPFALELEDPAIGLLQACRELGVAVVAYSPLGRGFLTGQIKSLNDLPADDFRRILPKYTDENIPKLFELVDKIDAVASKRDCTPSQVTLAWLLAQGDDIFPIPGTRGIKYLEENTAAANIKLPKEDVQKIRDAAESGRVHAARYPEGMAASIFADTPPL